MIGGMNISLTPQLEKYVERKVKEGRYQTASEVMRAALRLLADHDELRKLEIKRLKKEVKIGLDQIAAGDTVPLDVEYIKAEGRKLQARRKMKRVG